MISNNHTYAIFNNNKFIIFIYWFCMIKLVSPFMKNNNPGRKNWTQKKFIFLFLFFYFYNFIFLILFFLNFFFKFYFLLKLLERTYFRLTIGLTLDLPVCFLRRMIQNRAYF